MIKWRRKGGTVCKRVTDMMWRVIIKRLIFPLRGWTRGAPLPHGLRFEAPIRCRLPRGMHGEEQFVGSPCLPPPKKACTVHPPLFHTIIHQCRPISFFLSLSLFILFRIILLNNFFFKMKKTPRLSGLGSRTLDHRYSPLFHKRTSKFCFGTEFCWFL